MHQINLIRLKNVHQINFNHSKIQLVFKVLLERNSVCHALCNELAEFLCCLFLVVLPGRHLVAQPVGDVHEGSLAVYASRVFVDTHHLEGVISIHDHIWHALFLTAQPT